MLRDLDAIIVAGPHASGSTRASSATSRPTASLASVLGDYSARGLGVLGLSWQSSPALTELEEVVTDWMRQMVGLSERLERRHPGHRVDEHAGRAALRARAATGFALAAGGLQAEPRAARRLRCRRTRTARSTRRRCSPASAATTCVTSPCDDAYAMRADALRSAMIARTWPRGACPAPSSPPPAPRRRPPSIRSARSPTVARDASELWLHVDAAMAGSAMILPECRWMWEGIEGADSLVLNAAQVARRRLRLLALLRADARAPGPRDVHQPQLPAVVGRRAGEELPRLGHPARAPLPRAEALVPDPRAGRRRAAGAAPPRPRERPLAGRPGAVDARTGGCWRRCRCRPSACATSRRASTARRSTPTPALVRRVNRSGKAYLTPAMLDGRWMVRVSIGAEHTERDHVEALWVLMQDAAAESARALHAASA